MFPELFDLEISQLISLIMVTSLVEEVDFDFSPNFGFIGDLEQCGMVCCRPFDFIFLPF
jgi:hypothetical protein